MSDSDARLKVTADTSGAVGPVDDLTKAQERAGEAGKKAADDLGAGYAKAAAAVDRFGEEAESGARSATRSLTLATVEIGKLEAEIARLKAQGQPTAALEAGLTTLRGKLAAGTDSLGRFKAAQADAADATRRATVAQGEMVGSVTDLTGTLKSSIPALAGHIDQMAIILAKMFAVAQVAALLTAGLRKLAEGHERSADGLVKTETATQANIVAFDDLAAATARLDAKGIAAGFLNVVGTLRATAEGLYDSATAFGVLTDAKRAYDFTGTLKVQRDLVQGHKEEVAALDRKAEALVREVETQKAAGEVQKFIRDEVQKTIDGYLAAGEPIDAALAEQAASLGIVATAQKQAATGAQSLADTTVSSAEARATAEEAASARTVAALEAENVKRQQAVDTAKAALDQITKENDASAAAANQANQGSANPNAEKAAGLKKTIQELEGLTLLTPEQQVQLDTAKNAYAGIRVEASGWFGTLAEGVQAQVGEADALREANAQREYALSLSNQAQASHEQVMDRLEQQEGGYQRLSYEEQRFIDVGLKAGDGIAGTFSDAGEAASNAGDSVQFLGDAATDTADAIADVGTAATTAGEEAKKGFDGSKEAVAEIAEAVVAWNAAMLIAEATIDRIATKLANLQLGS